MSARAEPAAGGARRGLDTLALLVLVIVVWQGLYEYAGEVAITPPWRTVQYASTLLGTTSFWGHVAETVKAFVYALLISAALGVAAGLVLGLRRFAGDVAEPILVALYTIPKVTLYPLMLLIFGLGLSAKVAFGVIHGIIPVILFTLNAVKNVNPVYLRTARVLRLDPWRTATTVLAPAVMPEIITGLRVGFSLTMLGVLIGEMFASQRGLGYMLMNAIGLHNVDVIMAITFLLIVFAATVSVVLLRVDHLLHRRT
jgi:NitT/TauT family transport system permease protein